MEGSSQWATLPPTHLCTYPLLPSHVSFLFLSFCLSHFSFSLFFLSKEPHLLCTYPPTISRPFLSHFSFFLNFFCSCCIPGLNSQFLTKQTSCHQSVCRPIFRFNFPKQSPRTNFGRNSPFEEDVYKFSPFSPLKTQT